MKHPWALQQASMFYKLRSLQIRGMLQLFVQSRDSYSCSRSVNCMLLCCLTSELLLINFFFLEEEEGS